MRAVELIIAQYTLTHTSGYLFRSLFVVASAEITHALSLSLNLCATYYRASSYLS